MAAEPLSLTVPSAGRGCGLGVYRPPGKQPRLAGCAGALKGAPVFPAQTQFRPNPLIELVDAQGLEPWTR